MHLLQTFLPGKTFAPIVTRDFRPPKPDPAGILHIAEQWGLEDKGESLIMVCGPAKKHSLKDRSVILSLDKAHFADVRNA